MVKNDEKVVVEYNKWQRETLHFYETSLCRDFCFSVACIQALSWLKASAIRAGDKLDPARRRP